MKKEKCKELAKRLVINAIEEYKRRFLLQEDLLNGEDRKKILEEIERIEDDIKKDKVKQLKDTLNRWYSLEDCDEEFEM